ncbi:MAG: hypothetical protein NT034_04450 [Candidatus Magasanikbacteria bacterium]|nr:hypothetical protein [Candidatus Magasanikbacteria bacterium]
MKKLQLITLCVIAVLGAGYFLVHLVPGKPTFLDIVSAVLGFGSLFWAIRLGEELDQVPVHPSSKLLVEKRYAPASDLHQVLAPFQRDPQRAIRVREASAKLPRPRPEATV